LDLPFFSFTAVTAGNTNVDVEGYNWATRICSSAQGLCKYPHDLAYAAVGCAVVWILTFDNEVTSTSAFLVRTAGLEPAQGFLPEGF
jgi:hypothetical protein